MQGVKGRRRMKMSIGRVTTHHLHDSMPPFLIHNVDPEGVIALV